MRRNAPLFFLFITLAWAGSSLAENVKVDWQKKYTGGGKVHELVVDASGNIYVTGTTKSNSPDFLTIKYNSAGVQQWASKYGGSREDTPSALKVDAKGNVYVTGSSNGGASAYDFLTVKYKPSGGREWVARLNNTENNSDFASDLTIDGSGNVYVTGGSRSTTTGYDIVIVKYNSAGKSQWITRLAGPGIIPPWIDDFGRYIRVDRSGNVYVAGTIETGSEDIVVIKLNSAGQMLWSQRYDGSNHGNDVPSGMEIDASGNIYVAGNSGGSDEDIILLKYTTSGARQWVKRYTSPGRYPEDAQDFFLDSAGHAYVTGSTNVRGNNNFVTLKYASNGARKWATFYDDATYGDGAYSLAVDDGGNVYVTGASQTRSLSYDIITLKYDLLGKRRWMARYSSAAHFDIGRAVGVDASGNVIVAGDSLNAGWVVIKYLQTP